LAVAYDSVLGESSVTYDPFQFWTAPSDSAPVLTATVASRSQINLAWAFTPNPGNGGFIVYRGGVEIARVTANIRAYASTGLVSSTTYAYTVRPYNSNPSIEGVVRADSLGVMSNIASEATAAVVVGWEAPVGIAAIGDTVINTEGILVEAVNLADGAVNTPSVVNGVTFLSDFSRDGYTSAANIGGLYGGGGVGAGLLFILQSCCYGANPIILTGLEIGEYYLLQVLVSDERGGSSSIETILTLGDFVSSSVLVNPANSRICRFVATATTQAFSSSYDLLAGFQTRKLS
jgi:hypothetical protein